MDRILGSRVCGGPSFFPSRPADVGSPLQIPQGSELKRVQKPCRPIILFDRKGNRELERNDWHKGTQLNKETRSADHQSRALSRIPHPLYQLTFVYQGLLPVPDSVSHLTHFHAEGLELYLVIG